MKLLSCIKCKKMDQKWRLGRSISPLPPTLQGNLRVCIPFLGIARPQSQFPHSCVCEQFIHSHDLSTCFPAAEQADRSLKYINLSQIYECRNWETEHYNSVQDISVSFLGIHKWEPVIHLQCILSRLFVFKCLMTTFTLLFSLFIISFVRYFIKILKIFRFLSFNATNVRFGICIIFPNTLFSGWQTLVQWRFYQQRLQQVGFFLQIMFTKNRPKIGVRNILCLMTLWKLYASSILGPSLPSSPHRIFSWGWAGLLSVKVQYSNLQYKMFRYHKLQNSSCSFFSCVAVAAQEILQSIVELVRG